MRRFKRYFKERWWTADDGQDDRPYFESVIFFQAADQDEADRLQDAMCEAIGCSDQTCGNGKDQQCPHFRFGSLKVMDDD